MVATDSEVRFRPANRVGRSAHRAPAAKPASSASSQPHGAGSGTVRPTITEARPPTSTCPSPPMLKTPLWKATAAPRPVMISGSIYASTFRKLLVLPKEPVSMLQYTTRGSRPVSRMVSPNSTSARTNENSDNRILVFFTVSLLAQMIYLCR